MGVSIFLSLSQLWVRGATSNVAGRLRLPSARSLWLLKTACGWGHRADGTPTNAARRCPVPATLLDNRVARVL